MRKVLLASVLSVACVLRTSIAQAPATARDSLRLADIAASRAAYQDGFAKALNGVASDDILLLHEGAPIVRGKSRVEHLLAAQTALRDLRLSWEPLRVMISQDGLFGATFGSTVNTVANQPPRFGRYISVWRRASGGEPWRLAAHVQIGLTTPRDYVASPDADQRFSRDSTAGVAKADLAFAQRAAQAGAPTAFGEFVAGDGMMFGAGGELNIGPATVRARMLESRSASAAWSWHPVVALVAGSGDLGATVGEAEIHPAAGGTPATSKYLTVWQRQSDGSFKFVVDGGNSRPASP
jgi:ketosteroid isomerase-like protein